MDKELVNDLIKMQLQLISDAIDNELPEETVAKLKAGLIELQNIRNTLL